MADIFISYSSHDREKAEQLTELLASAGLSVWIDQSGIDVATSWSGEITQAINDCKAFVVLLSPSSVASHNVGKEVSLASERKKKILPLDLEPVELPNDLAYHLAGIQRAPMTNIDSIIRALGKLGLEATQAPTLKLVKETDSRKSLMILPFEDLSPTADNQWFADGLAAELISALSNVKSLKVKDQQTTKAFKKYNGHLTMYAKEMSIRYFIQGSVRKFGDQIKITSSLLDIETGDNLWQDSLKGTMENIFDIQETVAKSVVEGLNVILTKDEEKKLEQKPTENAEAYELYLKARALSNHYTKVAYEKALSLFEESIALDPNYWEAYRAYAHTCSMYNREYSRESRWLDRAMESIQKAEELVGGTAAILGEKAFVYYLQGRPNEAIELLHQAVAIDDQNAMLFNSLGVFCIETGKFAEAAKAFKQALNIDKEDVKLLGNLVNAVLELDDPKQLEAVCEHSLPIYKKYLHVHPESQWIAKSYALALYGAGKFEEAQREADRLSNIPDLDSNIMCDLGTLYQLLGMYDRSLELFQTAVQEGARIIEVLRAVKFDKIEHQQRFEGILKELEEKIAEEKKGILPSD